MNMILPILNPPISIQRSIQRSETKFVSQLIDLRDLVVPWPHISLIESFDDIPNETLIQRLRAVTSTIAPFHSGLHGFGHFDTHTLFWQVKNAEAIRLLGQKVHVALTGELGRSKWPHVTVISGLEELEFDNLWDHYSQRTDEFDFLIDRITLLRDDGDGWVKVVELPFNAPPGMGLYTTGSLFS